MKFTKYFLFRRNFEDRAIITNKWIKDALANPLRSETQNDGRIKVWGKIE